MRDPGELAVAALLCAGSVTERFRVRRGILAAIPVLGVNTVAFLGQLRYWGAYLADPLQQVLVAAVLESIAIYWAWQAHRARMANDSAFRPQLAAYLTAAGVGVLNYSHFMLPGWRPTVAAVTFGGMSVISPWLWASYSRRENRDELKARGDIEDHAVRLGATRWSWHAFRCMTVMWLATWPGVTKPAEAIALFEAHQAGKKADREPLRTVTRKREARTGQVLAAPSPPEISEDLRAARREAGRRGAAIRWGKDLEAVPAGVNGNGGGHDGA